MKTQKRMTKLEMCRPELHKLAADVGGSIYYRAGEWWLAPWDKQLTYAMDARDRCRPRRLDLDGKAALAKELLLGILEARRQPAWGTEMERAERILKGLREEVVPNYRRGNYCYYRHGSMDAGCVFMTPSKWAIWVNLIGKPEIKAESSEHDDGEEEQEMDRMFAGLRTLCRSMCREDA